MENFKMKLYGNELQEIQESMQFDGYSDGFICDYVVVYFGSAGLVARGQAAAGDKTMVDVWLPVAEVLKQAAASGVSLKDALQAAARTAQEQAEATIPLVAKKGRASYLGERSAGHKDPGAASSALLLQCLAEVV